MRRRNSQWYIVEVPAEDGVRYLYTKRVSLACPELAKRFAYRKSAKRFYLNSVFCTLGIPMRIRRVTPDTHEVIEEPEQEEL